MTISHVPIAPLGIDRFQAILHQEAWGAMERARARSEEVFGSRVVWNVNSTAYGGGVAEMLRSLIAYARGVGVDARWVVIGGDDPFFRVTKRMHNFFHGDLGDGGSLGDEEREIYERTLARSAGDLRELIRDGDLLLLHDPQTAGLVPVLKDVAPVVWRSHIGIDKANEYVDQAWAFILPYIREASGWIFSRREYAPPQLANDGITIIPPSIDAFSPKNEELTPEQVRAILVQSRLLRGEAGPAKPRFTRQDGTPGRVDRHAEISGDQAPQPDVPLVVQVSRWDRLKDPLGVLLGFAEYVAPQTDAHLMLAGPEVAAVADDPEGLEVVGEVRRAWAALPEDLRARVHLANLPMTDAEENAAIVNAIQRHATVVLQKSLAEGFGLTVAEAMWKARPVVASRVGGIQDQIEHEVSGLLLDDASDLASYGSSVVGLLQNAERADRIGAAARERVREHFLSARHLIQYEQLFEQLVRGQERAAA